MELVWWALQHKGVICHQLLEQSGSLWRSIHIFLSSSSFLPPSRITVSMRVWSVSLWNSWFLPDVKRIGTSGTTNERQEQYQDDDGQQWRPYGIEGETQQQQGGGAAANGWAEVKTVD